LSTQREVPPTVRSTFPAGQSQTAVRGFGLPPGPQAKFSAADAMIAATRGALTSKQANIPARSRMSAPKHTCAATREEPRESPW
jgi:hypothetical protein